MTTQTFRKALRRDGYRCMVTGKYDSGYVGTLPVATLDTLFAAGFRTSTTHLAHIFPPPTSIDLSLEAERHPKVSACSELFLEGY